MSANVGRPSAPTYPHSRCTRCLKCYHGRGWQGDVQAQEEAGPPGGGGEASLAIWQKVSLSLLQMQQMCFSGSSCRGELGASESRVSPIHLFCKVLGLRSFKMGRHHLAEKNIPSRKYAFYFKTTLVSGSVLWGHSCFYC